MKFRRSMKSEGGSNKHDSAKPVQISIPQKDAIAIEPPKKVIKALYDYKAPEEPGIYLAFSAGDFLHVVSRENDPDWYEACNPLANTRGLVPVKYFENVGKTVRDSGDSLNSGSATHDSGYAEGATPSARSAGTSRTSTMNDSNVDRPPMPGHRSSKSIGKIAGGVYGIVSYDFHAERPDELDAKEGEAIIVIAQSNPEWFVAKPITRLGGPGLIPVSFIEIRDMTTGQAVDDAAAAVAKAGIPRVEEWKKMAAEYKNTSIPLGTVSSSQQAQNLQQGMERMSLSSGQQTNGYGGHSRQPSNYSFHQQQAQNLFAPERASVPRYIYSDDKFHFIVECRLSNGSHWDLQRVYEDFYELQINLINAFPEEAGQVPGKPRILPYMPGPVKFVTDGISEGRRANLDEYLRDLLRLQSHITCSSLVRNFFAPRENDYEVDPTAVDLESHARPLDSANRYSQTSQGTQGSYQQNGGNQAQGQMRQPANGPAHQHNQSQASNGPYGHQRGLSSNTTNHYRSPSEYSQQPSLAPPVTRQTTATSATSASSGTVAVKVKAWFDRDTCVVLRMPPRGQFSYEELYRKIVERRRLEYKGQDQNDEDLDIEYRDEKDGEYYRLEGDEDLDIAVERNDKLTLAVRAAGS
ncbi:hypothetical protein LTR85_007379 [Meristemomyces frigidus]|nr:hypothetical protein LTR85_007379 [Meristemomyces frigidus]